MRAVQDAPRRAYRRRLQLQLPAAALLVPYTTLAALLGVTANTIALDRQRTSLHVFVALNDK